MLRVLVQAGHAPPREPGFEQGTGTTKEIELALAIQASLVALLTKDERFEPVPVPGDIPDGIKVDAAIFLHGDGSSNQAATGYCFGYPNYPVNKKLADLIGEEFERVPGHPPHRLDNYTDGLRFYYGYRRVDTLGPEVLVEHGFLTNPGERLWLFANAAALARAEYVALCRYFELIPLDDLKEDDMPTWFPAWWRWRLLDGQAATRPSTAPTAIPQKYLDLVKVAEEFRAAKPDGTAPLLAKIEAAKKNVAAAKFEISAATTEIEAAQKALA